MNPANPCRCAKKTKGLIQEGKIDLREKTFTTQTLQEVQNLAPEANGQLDVLMEGKYLQFFMQQPYEQTGAAGPLLDTLLFDKDIKHLFQLN